MNVLSVRDRRVVLWFVVAAICWRWLLAARTPLPGSDACHDLWLAAGCAGGDLAALGTQWWAPFWALLLAPAVACGSSAWLAAQVGAAVLGGLAAWPLAVAAERRRAGAGVAAAALCMVAPGLCLAAGLGTDGNLVALLVASALGRWGAGARGTAVLCLLPGLGMLVGVWRNDAPLPDRWLAGAGLLEPLLAFAVALGLARLPSLGRDLLLCVVVAPACYVAWHGQEAPSAAIERWLGRHLASRLQDGELLVSDRPRVAWAAGQRPVRLASSEAVLAAAASPEVAWLVLGEPLAASASLSAALAGTFARHPLPNDVVDAVAERGLSVLIRR
jgi:hypothetical protein